MLQGNNIYFPVVVSLDHDPAADDDIAVWRAPASCNIRSAYWTNTNAVAASTANYFDVALWNGGTAGTALSAIAGTIGGTGGWTALTPVAFTIGTAAVAAGELVKVRYNEEGTGTFAHAVLQLDVTWGA